MLRTTLQVILHKRAHFGGQLDLLPLFSVYPPMDEGWKMEDETRLPVRCLHLLKCFSPPAQEKQYIGVNCLQDLPIADISFSYYLGVRRETASTSRKC